MIILCLTFYEVPNYFPQRSYYFTFPPAVCAQWFKFLHILTNTRTLGVLFMAQQLTKRNRIHEDVVSILGLAQWVREQALL